jgi:hypothetical protein
VPARAAQAEGARGRERGGDGHAAIDGRAEHGPAVVIGVVADELDPPGSPGKGGGQQAKFTAE